MQTWYEQLQNKLKEKGLTQRKLAKSLHRSEGAISQYLTGERDPSPEMFGKLCAAAGASADELLGLTPEQERRASHTETVMLAGYLEAAAKAVNVYVTEEDRRRVAEAAEVAARGRALLGRRKRKIRAGGS